MGVTSEEGGGRGLKFHFNNGAKSCRIHHGLVREGSLGKIRSRPGRAVLATGGYQEISAREPISISRWTPQQRFRTPPGGEEDKLLLGRIKRAC